MKGDHTRTTDKVLIVDIPISFITDDLKKELKWDLELDSSFNGAEIRSIQLGSIQLTTIDKEEKKKEGEEGERRGLRQTK